jgi:hypothetical protein
MKTKNLAWISFHVAETKELTRKCVGKGGRNERGGETGRIIVRPE